MSASHLFWLQGPQQTAAVLLTYYYSWGSVAGPVFQENGRLTLDDDLRLDCLLYCTKQWNRNHTELANSMVHQGTRGWTMTSTGFGISFNPISTRGGKLCPGAPVSMGTCPHQVLADTLTLFQQGGIDYTIYWCKPGFQSHRRAWCPSHYYLLTQLDSYVPAIHTGTYKLGIHQVLTCPLLLKSKFEFWNLNITNIAKF